MRSLIAAVLVFLCGAATANANVLITIDKSTQRMTVSVDGSTRWVWPVSTGRRGHATPSGTFQAFRMEADHYSKEWDDAPMPHSIFFTRRGHAIHGSYDTRRLGTPASAGCVRLHPDNAKQLFALVQQRGVLNATVTITGGEHRAPAVAAPTARGVRPVDDALPRTGRRIPPDDGSVQSVDPRSRMPLYRPSGEPPGFFAPPADYGTVPRGIY